MGNETDVPDKVGEEAEARSFEKGYRGAWFRCTIMEVGKCTYGTPRFLVKYSDFDDESEWLKLYQVTPWKLKFKELMLRPPYPRIYNAKEMPHASEISEVSVIVDDSWKVGDLVDWFTTGCYWSGTITKLLGDAMAKIELHKPPIGEGLDYKIELKDVRPSLDWSPEFGWAMPKPTREGDCGRPSAFLLKPKTQEAGNLQITNTQNSGKETEVGKGTARSSSPSVSEEVKSIRKRDESKKSSTSAAPTKPNGRQRKISSGSRDIKTDSGQLTSAKSKADNVADRDQNNNRGRRDIKTDSEKLTSAKPKADNVADRDQSNNRGCRDIKTDYGKLTSAKPKADNVADRDQSNNRGCRDIKTDSGKLPSAKPKADNVADRDQSNNRGCRDIKTDSGKLTSAKPKADVVVDGDKSNSRGCRDMKIDSEQQPKADDVADKNKLGRASSMEKYTAGGASTLNCTRSDTLEAAVLDLEEYLSKVKWLKRILRHGISASDAPENQWEFLEPLAAPDKTPN